MEYLVYRCDKVELLQSYLDQYSKLGYSLHSIVKLTIPIHGSNLSSPIDHIIFEREKK